MFTRYEISPDAAFGGWLMPVVPPMVSAANGALLIPYARPGQGLLTLLLACYAMFGISPFASVIMITQSRWPPGVMPWSCGGPPCRCTRCSWAHGWWSPRTRRAAAHVGRLFRPTSPTKPGPHSS